MFKTQWMTTFAFLVLMLSSMPGSAQVKQPIQAPAGLDEGTETKLTPDLTSELRDWANSSQSKLQDLLQTSDHMSSMPDVKRYLRKGIETVVLGSAPRQTELLMRYVLNRAIKASDTIEKDSDVSAIGVVDQQVRILRNSVQFAIQYAKDDLAAIENATSNGRGETIANLPYARFGVKYSAFLMDLDLSITDASAQYDIALFALGLLQWDLYRDEKHNLYATAITKLNDAIAILGDTAGKNDGETVQKLSQARLAYEQAIESLPGDLQSFATVLVSAGGTNYRANCSNGVEIGPNQYYLQVFRSDGYERNRVEAFIGPDVQSGAMVGKWTQGFDHREDFSAPSANCLLFVNNGNVMPLTKVEESDNARGLTLVFVEGGLSIAVSLTRQDSGQIQYGSKIGSQHTEPVPQQTVKQPALKNPLDLDANGLLQMNSPALSTSIGVGADAETDTMPGKDIGHAIVQVSFGGVHGRQTGGANENTFQRWFMVSIRAGYTVQQNSGNFDVIDLQIVPFHKGSYWTNGAQSNGASTDFQEYSMGTSWMPVSYQRDIKLGLERSATVKLVAFDGAINSDQAPGFSFIFDAIGMRLYKLANEPDQQLEGYLAGAGGEMNKYWDLGNNNYINWTVIGIRGDLGLGTPSGSLGVGMFNANMYSSFAVVLGKSTEIFTRWDLKYLVRSGLQIAHRSSNDNGSPENVFKPWYSYNRLQLGVRRKF